MHRFALLVIVLLQTWAVWCGEGPGTTEHIKDIFIGRCWDYQLVKHSHLLNDAKERDCDELWDTFSSAFSHKEPCDVTFEDYHPFMKDTEQEIQPNKSMFWSGIYDEAHEFAEDGKRYITLEDTFLGYLVNGLIWCGQVSEPGINYESCPTWGTCSDEATNAFWGSASTEFAVHSRGEVIVMLNGSNPHRPAFSKTSYFASFELPNLNPEVVTKVLIFVLHDFEIPVRENCTSGSLPELKSLIQKRGLDVACYDNPNEITHMLCIDEAETRECRLARRRMRQRMPGFWNRNL